MSTIFPGSASVGQIFDGYEFNGTAWDIIGIDLTADYPEIIDGKISASVIPSTFATTSYVNQQVGNINLSPYLTQSSASTTYITQASASTTYATKTELNNIDLSSASAAAVAAIVDSAPSTLNTLNELAAALGDDANYASTITTALGNKLDTSTASSTYQPLNGALSTLSSTFGNITIQSGIVNFANYGMGMISWSLDTNTYLTEISASTTYITQASASTTYATKTELNNIDALPSQSGNGGKYLTTSGSVASWSTIDLTSAINTASAAAVTYLVDSAPAALDTLNELAAALGDDANYASTITTALGTKAPLASPTFTGSVTTGEAITKTTSTVFTSSSATTIATFPLAYGKCIAVECVVLISSESTGSYTSSKVLITADPDFNSIADITEYAIMNSRDDSLFPVLTATISGQNVLLRAAVSNFTATTAKVISTSILSPLGAA